MRLPCSLLLLIPQPRHKRRGCCIIATLRDTLLSRLISGQLRLPEAISLLAIG
jgi:hypothetical protein